MARTIFGIFALWLKQKQEADYLAGHTPSNELSCKELDILAVQYNVSNYVVYMAHQMWALTKVTKKHIQHFQNKAVSFNGKDKIFLYNSLVKPRDMVFNNIDHNHEVCCGDKASLVRHESTAIGIYSDQDDYFIYDKDFGFMSFNEIRNSELSMAIQDWFDVEK